jgi:hypothetical protein
VVYSLVADDVLFSERVSFGHLELESSSLDPTAFEVVRSCVRAGVDRVESAQVASVQVASVQAASVLALGLTFGS